MIIVLLMWATVIQTLTGFASIISVCIGIDVGKKLYHRYKRNKIKKDERKRQGGNTKAA